MCIHVCVKRVTSLRGKGVGGSGLFWAVPSHPWEESLRKPGSAVVRKTQDSGDGSCQPSPAAHRWAAPSKTPTGEGGQTRHRPSAPQHVVFPAALANTLGNKVGRKRKEQVKSVRSVHCSSKHGQV